MKFMTVLIIGSLSAAVAGAGASYFTSFGPSNADIARTMKSVIPKGKPTIPSSFVRGEHYYFCSRHFAFKSTRRTSREKTQACECFDYLARSLSQVELRDARWALRSQYADLSTAPPRSVKVTKGLVGSVQYSAIYSDKSANLLQRCDARIRIGERRSS